MQWQQWQRGLSAPITLPEALPPLRMLLVWDNLQGHKTPADMVHFGVMDNHYVPNLTVGPLVCRALRGYGVSVPIDRSLQLIRDEGCKSGLVFNPATPLIYLDYVLDKVDMVLLMSVNPGFGGQKFIPRALDKLREARRLIDESGYDIRLEIDGGVKVDNIREIAEAGADTFVAGSAIFGAEDYRAVIAAMRAELAKAGS